MKKFITITLVLIMLLTFGALAACNEKASVVRITLYTTSDAVPRAVLHTVGQDDLQIPENGNLVFDGWYYDEAFDKPYKYTDDIAEGTCLYAKWKQGASDKVTLTLNLGYAGSTPIVTEMDKNATPHLDAPTRQGYTFGGWFTEANGNGIQWNDSKPVSADLTLYAKWTSVGGGNQGGDEPDPVPTPDPVDLSNVFNKYKDSEWNFAVTLTILNNNNRDQEYFEYYGYDVLNRYTYQGDEYTDYLAYDESGTAYWYYDNGDGTYDKYSETSQDFIEYFYMNLIYLDEIGNYSFIESNGCYLAQSPNEAGNAVIAEYDDGSKWTSFAVYIDNEVITKIVGIMDDGYTMTFEFSKYGQVSFTLPEASQGGSSGGGSGDPLPTEPTGVMDNQVYDEATFDNSNLQDKLLTEKDENGDLIDGAIGLPSTGTYNALVIPVQFKGNTITQTQLNNLNIAFNGTSEQTGWESVKSFYQKSSYGKLNITYDIQPVFQASKTSSEYAKYTEKVNVQGETWEKDGSALILEEALAWCVSQGVDLSKYDTNGDGCIDAVYLIYSESVDYDNADFFWAYVTWYYGDTQFGGKDAYYYLFAGFDFMTENLDKMDGVKINAETYVHETGHLLGLDDYYDYYDNVGSNQGLGGADMMDYNVGDHGVYSKIMLGWLNPEIVTSTQTITIQSSQAGGYAILIPLNWNNSYFCEYLLIDLYTADGLNSMGASQQNTILYGGTRYGVRIYHVSSSINNPYSDEYGSFTDNNNSYSNIPLIKLVEADGNNSIANGSYAGATDLWQAGDTFSGVYSEYMRNDGKTLNFDISIDSVSASEATVTITYNTAA